MENIFENAYYGKSYKTRLGGKAIYHYKLDNPTGDGKYDAWHFLIMPGEKSHMVCLSNGKSVGATAEWDEDIVSEWQELIVCKCQWEDYYDYRIMTENGNGHVRVSFFDDEICISDLFVDESCRKQGIATALLNKVDELLDGRQATIVPLQDWCKCWYAKRGYTLKQD